MERPPIPRALTHDEQKAAEAAFAGRPFNPAWSASARRVYDGLRHALPKASDDSPVAATSGREPEAALAAAHEENVVTSDVAATGHPPADTSEAGPATEGGAGGGILIDVTDDAKRMGVWFPVMTTPSLWDVLIATSHGLPAEEQAARLRDILMAFRLRLAIHPTLSPLIDFPVLLAMPPDHIPQPIPLFALIQPDGEHRPKATLLLPNEISTTMIPMP